MRSLPWPVTLDTNCGSFTVFRSGRVIRASLDRWLTPDPGYRVPAGVGKWAQVQQGHVVFIDGANVEWRSAGAGYDPQQLDGAALGPGWVSFAFYVPGDDVVRLYFAPLAGSERVIALDEAPLTAAPWGGLIVSRWKGTDGNTDIVARRADGSFLRLAVRDAGYLVPERGGTILYRDGHRVVRTDGLREVVLTDGAWLGNPKFTGITTLPDGRVTLTGIDRIELLTRNGTVLARGSTAPIPAGGWGYLGAQMTVEPGTGAVVFTATHWSDAGAGGGDGWEGVYRLSPGGTRADLVFGRRLTVAVCAHSASFSWHERWLLYSACEGRIVAIDASGGHSPIVLTALARSVPIPPDETEYGLYSAEWAPFGSPAQLEVLTRLA